MSWFLEPLSKSIKGLIRPATALTRRKELSLVHPLPMEAFQEFMKPLTAALYAARRTVSFMVFIGTHSSTQRAAYLTAPALQRLSLVMQAAAATTHVSKNSLNRYH